MSKISKLWTGAVAYVSLLVGAGLSVAGNLADTYRTRGADVDTLDKVMAAGWPILVLLAIEMFVSPRWSTARMFQAWRWLGCLAVGGMAMVVSWTHLHDLMASRGQLYVVSVLGPLAIDGMAIMATGLILSTRVRGHAGTDDDHGLSAIFAATDSRWADDGHGHAAADCADTVATPDAAARYWPDRWPRKSDVVTDGHSNYLWPRGSDDFPPVKLADMTMATEASEMTDADIVATRPQGDLDAWQRGYEDALSELGQEVATDAEQFLATVTPATDRLPQRTRTAPQEFLDMVAAATDWTRTGRAAFVVMAADKFSVSTRTARRWLSAAMPADGA
jgi:hypothetical protein